MNKEGQNSVTRRQFLAGAAVAFLNPGAVLNALENEHINSENLTSKELLNPGDLYGFTRDTTPVWRHPNQKTKSIGAYHQSALLRFQPVNGTDFVRIQQDTRPIANRRRELAHGELYVPYDFISEITPEQVAPIPLNRPNGIRRIEVNLRKQVLEVREDEQTIFETDITSGKKGYETPNGKYRIFEKRWARYMQGPDFDLPGVPFTQYFTGSGAAIHGAYWRSSFGVPGSHGCINVSNGDAMHLYRLTTPVHTSFSEQGVYIDRGATIVSIQR